MATAGYMAYLKFLRDSADLRYEWANNIANGFRSDPDVRKAMDKWRYSAARTAAKEKKRHPKPPSIIDDAEEEILNDLEYIRLQVAPQSDTAALI